MKLIARAAIDAAETGHGDVRPGDTFEADAKLADALVKDGKAEAVKEATKPAAAPKG